MLYSIITRRNCTDLSSSEGICSRSLEALCKAAFSGVFFDAFIYIYIYSRRFSIKRGIPDASASESFLKLGNGGRQAEPNSWRKEGSARARARAFSE